MKLIELADSCRIELTVCVLIAHIGDPLAELEAVGRLIGVGNRQITMLTEIFRGMCVGVLPNHFILCAPFDLQFVKHLDLRVC